MAVPDPATTEWVPIWNPASGSYDNEQAQDAVGTILVDSATIDLTYDDGVPSITAAVIAGAIGTTQLTDGGVTYAKVQDVTDNRLLGRSAGSDGDVQEITIGAGLSLSAGVLTGSGGTPSGTANTVAIFDGTGALTSDTDLTYDAATNYLGLGLTPSWTFDVQSTQVQGTTAALFHTARIAQTMTLNADSTLQSYALRVESNFDNATFFPTGNAALGGISVHSKYLGQYTIPRVFGVRITLENAGTNNVSNGYGVSVEAPVIGASSFNFFSAFRVITTSGTIPTRGFRGEVSSGTGRYNLYLDGTAQNYMIGNLGIGSGKTVPAEALDVNGAIRLGTTTNTNNGTIRYTGTAFEGCNGGAWAPLGAAVEMTPGSIFLHMGA